MSRKKIRNKATLKPVRRRKLRKIDIIGFLSIGVFLVMLWVICLSYLLRKDYFGYHNYFDQPIGTLMLLIILIIGTPVYLVMLWRQFRGTADYTKPDDSPSWMKKPPFKLPWE